MPQPSELTATPNPFPTLHGGSEGKGKQSRALKKVTATDTLNGFDLFDKLCGCAVEANAVNRATGSASIVSSLVDVSTHHSTRTSHIAHTPHTDTSHNVCTPQVPISRPTFSPTLHVMPVPSCRETPIAMSSPAPVVPSAKAASANIDIDK